MSDAPILTGEGVQTAQQVGERLRRSEQLPAQPVSVAQGHPGLALLFHELHLACPGEGWDGDAHRQLAASVRALREERAAPTGLHQGLAGIAFAAATIDASRYGRLLGTLDGLIAARVERLDNELAGRRACAESEIDVISGLAGIGAYLLTRENPAALERLLARLVALIRTEGRPPAWHTPPDLAVGTLRGRYAEGYSNCGLAHGIAGPVALLALAADAGIEVDGQREALTGASAWLTDHAFRDDAGPNWPAVVPIGYVEPLQGTRAGWCYGAPGVTRALWLAGTVLGDSALRELAVDGLEAVHRRPWAARQIDAPTFCHGYAGLLQITLRMANDSGSSALRAAAGPLGARLIDAFEPESAFGYRELDPDGDPFDSPGLLEGAAGTALVLLAAAADAAPRWDRLFLLA